MDSTNPIQHGELEIRSEPQGDRLGPEGFRNATCRARDVGVGGRVRWAALQVGWREGTHRLKLARQLEPSTPATAWTVTMKLPPRKSEDTCQGPAWRGAERSPPGTVERRNAQLGQDLSSSCQDASVDLNLHEQARDVSSFKARFTGIPGVREESMRACVSRFEWQAHKAVFGQTRLRALSRMSR